MVVLLLGALLRQYLVGFVDLFEVLFAPLVGVRMILFGEEVVGFFYVRGGGGGLEVEDFVVVFGGVELGNTKKSYYLCGKHYNIK